MVYCGTVSHSKPQLLLCSPPSDLCDQGQSPLARQSAVLRQCLTLANSVSGGRRTLSHSTHSQHSVGCCISCADLIICLGSKGRRTQPWVFHNLTRVVYWSEVIVCLRSIRHRVSVSDTENSLFSIKQIGSVVKPIRLLGSYSASSVFLIIFRVESLQGSELLRGLRLPLRLPDWKEDGSLQKSLLASVSTSTFSEIIIKMFVVRRT